MKKNTIKRNLTAVIAVLLSMSAAACGNSKLPPAVTDDTVYDDIAAEDGGTKPVTTAKKEEKPAVSGSTAVTSEAPAPASAKRDYLKSIMFVGDDMAVPLADTGRTDSDYVFALDGAAADDILGSTFTRGGSQYTPVQWAEENKPSYIYIWLGLNDLKYCNDYSYYLSIANVVNTLHEASPDSVIIMMQLSPVARESTWDSETLGGDGHYDISVYNDTIRQMIADSSIKELYFFEINSVLGEDGGTWLDPAYDSGDGIHLTADAYTRIVEYIDSNRYANEKIPVEGEEYYTASPSEDPDASETAEETSEAQTEEGTETPDTETDDSSTEPLADYSGNYSALYPDMYAERPSYTVESPKMCYLTFDDGPSDYTPEILDILSQNNIKASFFIVGKCVDGREDILRRTAEEGHTVGIHTYSHDYEEIYESADAYLNDFSKAYDILGETAGIKPWLFRFPGGSYNSFNTDTAEEIITEMDRRGFTYFDWNCATSDAAVGADYDSCVENFKSTLTGDYEIVLMHDSKETTTEYLQDIIDYAVSEGYTFGVLDNADTVHF